MIGQEFRQTIRGLRKNPGFTIVALLTLALGIGVNTAIFSVIDGVLLEPLAYREPARIVALDARWQQTGRQIPRLSGGDLMDIRSGSDAFDALSYVAGGEMGVQLADHAEFTGVYFVNADFLRVFQLVPAAGRFLSDADAERAAVVSAAFAERNFGSAAKAVARAVSIDGRNYEIAGVLPAGFAYPTHADIWVTAPVRPQNLNRTASNYPVIARLRPGATVAEAQAELSAIGTRLANAFPQSNRGKMFLAVPLQEQLVGRVRSTLYILMGAVALVLLIACANVANLMLARATLRSRDMAVRAALGAGRWLLARQLLVESAVLGTAGGALGLILARAGVDLLARWAPENLPRMNEVRLDWAVLAFATVVSLVASTLFGLAPAWQAARADVNEALKQGCGRGLAGGGSNRLRHSLVVSEIALSVVLAIGAGLLFRSFLAMSAVDPGFRTEGLLVLYAHVPARGFEESLQAAKFVENLFPELTAIPGVKSVAAAMGIPAGQYGSNGAYTVEGQHIPNAPPVDLPQAGFRLASPGYFATMGIPLRAGRDFMGRDGYNAPFVAIVSEALVKQSFPNEDPMGKRILCGLDAPGTWMTIVGVVGDVRQQSPAAVPGPEIYMPLEQHPYYANEVQVVMRTSVEPASLIGITRRKVREANPAVAMKFTTMGEMISASVSAPRFRAFLVTAFAALALLLATAGVYGVVAYVTARRTAELGLRMALGAGASDVLWLILERAAAFTGIGLAIGVTVSFAAGRALRSMLFGLQPLDPETYLVVVAAVAVVALIAAAIPALRAARIDPLTALREE
ncbi:MAG TPA: ABC transporter permease [Bryobacteraceae bacterium]|nr:ABC transporter permease [Bryobacteraceae bacterium]